MIKERKTDVEYEIIMSCEQCIRGRNNPLEDHLFLQQHKKEIYAVWRRMTRVNNSVTYSLAQRHWMIRIAESPLQINTVTVRHIHIAKEPRDYQINRVVLIYKEPVFTRITLLCCIIHHIFFLNRVIRQFLINFMFIFCSYFYY